MRKPDFERCTKEATALLYQQDLSNRILNIRNLNYDKRIIFETIQSYCTYTKTTYLSFILKFKNSLKDGCTIHDKQNDVYIVLYNDNVSYFEHRNWTLAHEIGHIYLGHEQDDDIAEIEANYFASQLFMPEYSLYMTFKEYGRISASDISEIYGVSLEAAKRRISTMNRKSLVDASTKSKEIWTIQKEKVDLYFDCKRDGADFRNTLHFLLQI